MQHPEMAGLLGRRLVGVAGLLNRFEGLHVETLKLEAEAEMARMIGCQAERPRRPSWFRRGLGAGAVGER